MKDSEPLLEVIEKIKNLAEDYHKLTPSEQKAVRHEIYKNQGKYGKAFIPLLNTFKDLNDEFK